jgi:hypothetical protein
MWCRGHYGPPRLPVDESQTRLAKNGLVGFSMYFKLPSEATAVSRGRFCAHQNVHRWRPFGRCFPITGKSREIRHVPERRLGRRLARLVGGRAVLTRNRFTARATSPTCRLLVK